MSDPIRFSTDPERRRELLDAFEAYWIAHPNWRFCQLVFGITRGDPFYVEDDVVLRKLKEWKREAQS